MSLLKKIYKEFINQAKHPIKTGVWPYLLLGATIGFLLSCNANASELKVGDCTIITAEPFLGYRAIVYVELPDRRFTVRFCDRSACVQINKSPKDLKKIPDVECDSIR